MQWKSLKRLANFDANSVFLHKCTIRAGNFSPKSQIHLPITPLRIALQSMSALRQKQSFAAVIMLSNGTSVRIGYGLRVWEPSIGQVVSGQILKLCINY